MTYSSCCGNGNYSASSPGYSGRREAAGRAMSISSSYGPDRADGIGRQTAPDHSWYQSGSGNPSYQAGVNKVASAYMKTPTCGKYKPVNNLLL